MNEKINEFVKEYIYEKISCRVKKRYEEFKQAKKIENQTDIYNADHSLVSLIMTGKINNKRNKYLLTPTITPSIIDKLEFGNCLNLVWGSDKEFDDGMKSCFGFEEGYTSGEVWTLSMLSTKNELNVQAKFEVTDVFPTERDYVLYKLTKTGLYYFLESGDPILKEKAENVLKSYAPFVRSLAYEESKLFNGFDFGIPKSNDPFINPNHINGNAFFQNLEFSIYLFYKKYKNDIQSCHESFFKDKSTTKISKLIENFFKTEFSKIAEQVDFKDGKQIYELTLYLLNYVDQLNQKDTDSEKKSKLEELRQNARKFIDDSVDWQLMNDGYRSGEDIADEFSLL